MLKKLILIFVMFTSINVYASSGVLSNDSIKTCPDGITYGSHKGNGVLHYHKAIYKGNKYYPDGDAIYYDPCSQRNIASEKTTTTARKTTTSLQYTTKVSKPITTVISKSSDTSIKEILINGKEYFDIKETNDYIIYSDKLDLVVLLNDEKSSFNIIGDNYLFNENENKKYVLEVTSEDKTRKNYEINVVRKTKKSEAFIKKFIIDGFNTEIIDNKIEAKVLNRVKTKNIVYELSEEDCRLDIYLNDKKINVEDFLDYDDSYKIVLTDKFGNKNEYVLKIEKYTNFEVFCIGLILFYIFRTLIGVIILLIKLKK